MNQTRATVEARAEEERLQRCRELYAERAEVVPVLDYDDGFVMDVDEEEGR
ncbi:hypothetical protein ACGFZB_28875 [Streptomyces cinerochromogenes]|uniref:Antitoxin n=1 Tax=Streptomyces cinerochromogenes TaxID=66422 RepID=A0ABW7BEA0_9ACTN